MGLRAAPCVFARKATQVELIDDFNDVACQMVFVQPVVNRGRQQVVRLAVCYDEIRHFSTPVFTQASLSHAKGKSDRLLAINTTTITPPSWRSFVGVPPQAVKVSAVRLAGLGVA